MTRTLDVLHHGAHSDAARALKAATNRRLEARDLHAYRVEESKTLSLADLAGIRKAAWALGAQPATYDAIVDRREVAVGVQRMILNPGRRTDAQRQLGEQRIAAMRADRLRREAARFSRSAAVKAFRAKVGVMEQPPGSNGGPYISMMQAHYGFGRVAWCGIAEGYHAEVYGGVKGLRSDVASVAAIENHARAGDTPYGHWTTEIRSLKPGSFLVIGGFGVHTEMLEEPLKDGSAWTIGGNTSFGPGGSQSNGGCIAHRHRSAAEIRGGASMIYPNED